MKELTKNCGFWEGSFVIFCFLRTIDFMGFLKQMEPINGFLVLIFPES